MTTRFIPTAVLSLLVLAAAIPARAQQLPPSNKSPEVSVSFSTLREEQGGLVYWDKGFQADVHLPVGRQIGPGSLGIVGDFSWHHNSFYDDSLKSYLGGLRYSFGTTDWLEPFVQVLAGTEKCCSTRSGNTYQPGAGFNVWVMERLAVRGEVDFRFARYTTGSDTTTYKETRFAIGAVLPLGKR